MTGFLSIGAGQRMHFHLRPFLFDVSLTGERPDSGRWTVTVGQENALRVRLVLPFRPDAADTP